MIGLINRRYLAAAIALVPVGMIALAASDPAEQRPPLGPALESARLLQGLVEEHPDSREARLLLDSHLRRIGRVPADEGSASAMRDASAWEVASYRRAGIVPGFEPPASSTHENVAWSWHIEPGAIYDAARDQVFAGVVDMTTGGQYVARWDAATGAFAGRTLMVDGLSPNDHNAPSVSLTEAGALVVVASPHNDHRYFYASRSADGTAPGLSIPTAYAEEGAVTYAQVSHAGDRSTLVLRVGGDRWVLWTNDEGADPGAWRRAGPILTSDRQTYARFVAQDGALVGFAWDHPTKDSPRRGNVYALSIDPAAPVSRHLDDLTPIVSSGGAGWSTRVLSVNADATQFAFSRFSAADPGRHGYHLARLVCAKRTDPDCWAEEDLGAGIDAAFWPRSQYVSGLELAGSGTVSTTLWLVVEVDGHHALQRWRRGSPSASWERETLMVSEDILARPLAPRGTGDFALVQVVRRYADFRDAEIDAAAVAWPAASREAALD